MLSQLHIENIAVISKATIDFTNGLNIFTGETGAGKTVLISAINAVLGGRVYKDIIRNGENKAAIVAVFTDIPDSVAKEIEEIGYEVSDGELIISREMSLEGKGSVRINGRPANAGILHTVSELLIDIHGQHDSRELLSPDRHLNFIDAYGDLYNYIDEYRESYNKLMSIREQLDNICMDENLKLQRQDILQYQIDEIAEADLTDGEEEELTARRDVIRNSERITEALSGAYAILSGNEDEGGVLSALYDLEKHLSDAGKFIEEFNEYKNSVSTAMYDFKEIARAADDYLSDQGFDYRELDAIEERLDLIDKLCKKYGPTVADVLSYYEKAIEELDSLIFSDKRIAQLKEEEKECLKETSRLADILTEKRKETGALFTDKIAEELNYLDMPNVKISLSMKKKDFSPNGSDSAELLISANVGEEPKPLSKIASGGELSRIMLVIKNVLADKDDIGTIIFDEVDTGVSGRAAYKIGKKLHEAARSRQIICVTHLAQVAAFAENHLKIYKQVEGDRTFTHVDVLDRDARIKELARINVGENITETALKAAEEMLVQSI